MEYKMFDRVLDKVTGKPCFITEIDDHGGEGVEHALEVEDQGDPDWFRLASPGELEKLPEHDEE